jgi:hypothetical protein
MHTEYVQRYLCWLIHASLLKHEYSEYHIKYPNMKRKYAVRHKLITSMKQLKTRYGRKAKQKVP